MLKVDGVVAVQADSLHQLLTDSSPDFIGADRRLRALGGTAERRRGRHLRRPRHRRLARAPVVRRPGQPRRPAGQGRRHAARVQLRRQPADARRPTRSSATTSSSAAQPFLATYLSTPAAPPPSRTTPPATRNGHGTHTGIHVGRQRRSTRRQVFGVERGPINGIAPGAWVSVYKVCGIEGCFDSDSAAAVAAGHPRRRRRHQLLDLGRHRPVHRPGRAGLPRRLRRRRVRVDLGRQRRPGRRHGQPPLAVGHHGRRLDPDPRVRVDADPHRHRRRDTFTFDGRLDHRRRRSPLPVVLSSARAVQRRAVRRAGPGRARSPARSSPASAACNARVEKGFNVLQGGAAGMILYNPTLADVETDNHWLPTVHLADGTAFVAFMSRQPGVTGVVHRPAQPRDGQGDVMAAFSSRGPGRAVHQARHHRAGRADPRRPHADPGEHRSKARPASTSRRSPARRCRRRTSPASALLLAALHPTGRRARSSRR